MIVAEKWQNRYSEVQKYCRYY